MSVYGHVCTAGWDRAPRERQSAARPLGVAFVVILRVAILALGLDFRRRRPLARRAAPMPPGLETYDPPRPHRNRSVSGAVPDLRRLPMGDPGRRAASQLVEPASRHVAGDRGAHA